MNKLLERRTNFDNNLRRAPETPKPGALAAVFPITHESQRGVCFFSTHLHPKTAA
jgi:hypothetical protein